MYRTEFCTLWEKARVGFFERTSSKHVYYLGWNRSPAQVGCMRQVLRLGALGRPRGIRWGCRWEGGSGWGTHVNPWLIHVSVWQKPVQYCKVISLQLIKINGKLNLKKIKKLEKKETSDEKLRGCHLYWLFNSIDQWGKGWTEQRDGDAWMWLHHCRWGEKGESIIQDLPQRVRARPLPSLPQNLLNLRQPGRASPLHCFSSFQYSHSIMPISLWPHGL